MPVPLLFLVAVLANSAAADQTSAAKVSVEGCVATGKEVGRRSDLAEKTGLDEHFVLVDARVVKGKALQVPGAADDAGRRAMFKISGLTDEQMKIHVAHRVRIEGSFGTLEQPSAPATPPDNLIELNVATIRQVPGACPAPRG